MLKGHCRTLFGRLDLSPAVMGRPDFSTMRVLFSFCVLDNSFLIFEANSPPLVALTWRTFVICPFLNQLDVYLPGLDDLWSFIVS